MEIPGADQRLIYRSEMRKRLRNDNQLAVNVSVNHKGLALVFGLSRLPERLSLPILACPQVLSSKIYSIHRNILRRGNMTTTSDIIEKCKANAAKLAVDENINQDCVVGIGSGSTMTYVLSRLAEKCKELNISVKCIPTSLQAKQLVYDHDFRMVELDQYPDIDVTIDGADEIDKNFVAIKGGGACLTQEKVVASASKKFVVVADYRKDSENLGDNWSDGIPIEVLPIACNLVRHKISRMFDADLHTVTVRVVKGKAGPLITDNGNVILDWKIKHDLMKNSTSTDWKALADRIKLIPGVVETGIFSGMIDAAYFGNLDGTVTKKFSSK